MKKLQTLLALSILCSAAGCAAPDNLHLKQDNVVVEYGETISMEPKDYLDETTSEDILNHTEIKLFIEENEQKVDAPQDEEQPKVGTYYITLTHEQEVEEVKVEVKDSVAPEFVDFSEEVSFEQGSEVDLAKIFEATDLTNVLITVEGEVDFTTVGEYKVVFKAVDENDNTTEKECIIKITEKEVAKPSNSSSQSSNKPTNKPNSQPSSNKPSSNSQQSSDPMDYYKKQCVSEGGTWDSSTNSCNYVADDVVEDTSCDHVYSRVGSTVILTDEYPGALAQEIYEAGPNSPHWHYYEELGLIGKGGRVDVYPVGCIKCKHSLKYTIDILPL